MRLIDADNIDFVILEDSLHRIEHKKGDEVDCVIGANEVKAIPLKVVEQILSEIDLQLDEIGAYNLQVAKVQRYIRDNIRGLKEQ